MEISETDRKIIFQLQKDGRASYTDLALKLGTSSSTIGRRVSKLIASKAIMVRALPNPYKMGHLAAAVILIKCTPKNIESVCDELKSNFYIYSVQTIFGRFNISLIVNFPSWELLHVFLNKELFSIDGIEKTEVHYVNEYRKRYHWMTEDSKKSSKADTLQAIDQQLIELLIEDGRASVNVLAKQLDIYESMVSRHISSLLRDEVIKICAVPNAKLLGYSASATVILEAEFSKIDTICNNLTKLPEVHLVITLAKGNSIILGVYSFDLDALYSFINDKILSMNGVTNSEVFVRVGYKKKSYGWLLEDEG